MLSALSRFTPSSFKSLNTIRRFPQFQFKQLGRMFLTTDNRSLITDTKIAASVVKILGSKASCGTKILLPNANLTCITVESPRAIHSKDLNRNELIERMHQLADHGEADQILYLLGKLKIGYYPQCRDSFQELERKIADALIVSKYSFLINKVFPHFSDALRSDVSLFYKPINFGEKIVVENLIEAGVSLISKNCSTDPLLFALFMEEYDIAFLFLKNGCDINSTYSCSVSDMLADSATTKNNANDRITPAFLAVLLDAPGTLKWLINHGANPNVFNERSTNRGNHQVTSDEFGNPLLKAIQSGSAGCLSQLLKTKEIDVNVKGLYNRTPLMEVVLEVRLDWVERLLAKGAEVNCKDSNGNTPLSLATKTGFKELIDLLLAAGAKDDSCIMPSERLINPECALARIQFGSIEKIANEIRRVAPQYSEDFAQSFAKDLENRSFSPDLLVEKARAKVCAYANQIGSRDDPSKIEAQVRLGSMLGDIPPLLCALSDDQQLQDYMIALWLTNNSASI